MADRPLPESRYYSGQGRIIVGERLPNGQPTKLFEMGNCTELSISIAVTSTDHKESMSGERAIDFSLTTEKTPTFSIICESMAARNLALAYWGAQFADEEDGSVVDEEHQVFKGGIVCLKHPGVSNVVPGTGLTAADYELDADFGTLRIKPTASVTDGAVVKFAYDYAKAERLEALTEVQAPERFIRFEGLNTVDGSFVVVEIPRAKFNPLDARNYINEDVSNVTIGGSILRDGTIVGEGRSKFFREVHLAADYVPVAADPVTP